MLALLLATRLVTSEPRLMPDGFTEAITVAANGEAIPFPTPGTSIRTRVGKRSIQIPAGTVYVPGPHAFAIGKFDVTNAEYGAFVEATGYTAPRGWPNGSFPSGTDNFPVQVASTGDAQAYVHWVTRSTGWRFALPSVDQLKQAARGVVKPSVPGTLQPVGSNTSDRSVFGAYDLSEGSTKGSFRIVALPPFAPAVP